MTTGRPDPGPNQRTAAVDTNDSAQTSSRSSRTCSLQPVRNRTHPNRTEHCEHRNRSQAANAAEQTRTGSNAATRDLKAVLLMTRHPETASEPLTSLPKPASDRKNHHDIAQKCTLRSHDLQQNTALPRVFPAEEKKSRNATRRQSTADPILALRTPRPTQNFTTSVGKIHEVSHRP